MSKEEQKREYFITLVLEYRISQREIFGTLEIDILKVNLEAILKVSV